MVDAGRIRLKISSPEKVMVDKEVLSVLVPSKEGPLLVLPRRAPYISSLDVGIIEINRTNGEKQLFFAEAGMVEVKDNVCTVLTEDAQEVTASKRSDYAAFLIDYKTQLKEAKTDAERELLNNHIKYIETLLSAVDKIHK